MPNTLKLLFHNAIIRQQIRLVAFVVFGVLIGVLCMSLVLAVITTHMETYPDARPQPLAFSAVVGEVMAPSTPIRLRVPAVQLDTDFEGGLGMNKNQEVEVPKSYEKVGWYKYGPTPGELGPAVVLGHVDSYEGPAVFFPLKNTKVGHEIFIDRKDGTTAVFTITAREKLSQDDFPTKAVYGDINHAGLRLVTCTGIFDKGKQRYSHNLIVYAELVRVEETS